MSFFFRFRFFFLLGFFGAVYLAIFSFLFFFFRFRLNRFNAHHIPLDVAQHAMDYIQLIDDVNDYVTLTSGVTLWTPGITKQRQLPDR